MADDLELGVELDGIVDGLVASGRYKSREAVLSEGVRLVEQHAAALSRFEAEIQIGLDDAAAGRSEDAEIVFAELLAELRAKLPDRSAA